MNTPNKITLTRIIIVLFLFIGLLIFSICNYYLKIQIPTYGPKDSSINLIYLIIFIIFVIGSLTDFLDGYLARKNNQITDLGKFLDPIADKMLVNSTLILLCVPNTFLNSDIKQISLSIFIVITFVVRDLVVDGLRFLAAKKNIVISANIFGKLKTISQMIAIPIYLLNGWPFSYFDYNWPNSLRFANVFMYIALFFSLLSMIIYLVQNKNVFLRNKDE